MKDLKLPDIIWIVEVIVSCALNILGLCLLLREKQKRPMCVLLINLGISNLAYTLYPMVVRITQLRSISDRPKWIKAGGLTTLVNQYLATALLTVDRVIMVRIHIKYAAVITKRRACYAIAAAWMISLSHASYYTCKTNQFQVFQTIVLAWDLTIILLLIIGYMYIFICTIIRKRKMHKRQVGMSNRRLKIEVALLIILSLAIFCLIPDVFLLTKVAKYTSWFPVLFYLNVITDPIIYIFTSKKRKKQLMKYFSHRRTKRSVRLATISKRRSTCPTGVTCTP